MARVGLFSRGRPGLAWKKSTVEKNGQRNGDSYSTREQREDCARSQKCQAVNYFEGEFCLRLSGCPRCLNISTKGGWRKEDALEEYSGDDNCERERMFGILRIFKMLFFHLDILFFVLYLSLTFLKFVFIFAAR